MPSRHPLVLALALAVTACGEADDDDGMADMDASVEPAQISVSWTVSDGMMDVGCDGVGASQVSVVAVPVGGGVGSVDSFACSALSGETTTGFEPGTYNLTFKLRTPGGDDLGEPKLVQNVVLVSGQTKAIGTVSFEASTTGTLRFTLDVGLLSGSNCGTATNDAKVTEMDIMLVKEENDECIPIAVTVDGAAGMLECPAMTIPCVENDQAIVTAALPAGDYFIDVIARRPDPDNGNALADCYGTETALSVYGGDVEHDVGKIALEHDAEIPVCVTP